MDVSKNKIIIIINKKMYQFKSSYKVVEYFKNEENINNVEGITEDMLYILQRPHMINRIFKYMKGEEQNYLKKESTIIKYCHIPNFTMMKV